ncbi:sce7726 family protein [Chromohalobacter canadensis]|uniref:Sce7726 family protein n=1 Tax=Chromohalobacter canadensis TaxID=141389 RepID=A0ABZ0Y7J5_9GAMM|nr:sce7726 family protein [Chromohalobacter canadensis]MCK0768825.1 sce7726 family protein [Chromohalobacter canadensis]WQH08025.1 sce7726 family protein [Chromohalobacter canadensis]
MNDTDPLAYACDLAYKRLLHSSRPEYVYKNVLLSKMVFGKHSPATTSWLYEFRVGEARADAVLINGVATAYEIKTDLDDFSRAQSQLEAYYSCFDRVVFVVGNGQVEKALKILPDYVGVLRLSNRYQLSEVRESVSNTEDLSSEAMFHLFRKREREFLQNKYEVFTDHLPPIERYSAARDAISLLPPRDVHKIFVEALRGREPATKRAAISKRLPNSLRAAAFGYKMKNADWLLLASRLQEPAYNAL